MKKIVLVLLVWFTVFGCSNDKTVFVEDAQYNTMHQHIFESEKDIVFINEREGTLLHHVGYIEKDTRYIVNGYEEDLDKTVDQLKSTQINYFATSYVYYKDNFYYVSIDRSGTSSLGKLSVFRSNVDGSKEELLCVLKNINLKDANFDDEKIYAHRDKLYVLDDGILYVVDIETKEFKKVEEVSSIMNVFFDKEIMYMFMENYEDTRYVLLKSSLEGKVEEVLYKDKGVIFVDDNYMFYLNRNEIGVGPLRVLDLKNEKEFTFEDDLNCYGVVKDESLYVFETRVNGKRVIHGIKDGTVVFEKEHNENVVIELLSGNRLYVSELNDQEEVGYFEIKENELSDLVMLKTKVK